jgi:hypothetical protein
MESALLLEKRPEVFGLPALVSRAHRAIKLGEHFGVLVHLAHDALRLATGLLAERLLVEKNEAAVLRISNGRHFRNSRRLAAAWHVSGG